MQPIRLLQLRKASTRARALTVRRSVVQGHRGPLCSESGQAAGDRSSSLELTPTSGCSENVCQPNLLGNLRGYFLFVASATAASQSIATDSGLPSGMYFAGTFEPGKINGTPPGVTGLPTWI